ncbi:zinc finger FYVE domain-containing protein 9-like isoform X2 [Stegostoma tigrinum]|uniref:zinc finger FYVE domain-containing protein 9-like isoform X2 n=1 Tax=Stegostoma tigrinum TaxID=3053191 RepID=UPI00202B4043|nr:zinc finger FYVE domain-containing protein 9-like isoform X2 [Stegostoma tigrinum]
MENYFQAEAFNLDKVLDEFEQNEDETESPSVFEAKWSQILDPPSHLLSLNPALSNVNMAALPSEMQARLKCHSSSSKSEIGLCGRGDRCHGNNTTGNLLLDRPQTNAEGVPERNKNSNCEHWSNSSPPVKPACENELYFSEDMNSSSVFGLIVQNSDSQLSHCGVVLQEDNSNNQNLMNVSTFVVENTNLQSGQLSSDMNGQTEKTVSLKSIEQLNTNCTDEMCVKSSFESLRNSVDLENLPPTSKESWMVNDLSVKICEQDVTSGLDGDTEINEVFCAACCSLKCKLNYMDMKEARVCVTCHTVLNSSQAWENTFSASASSPNPNNPAEYCSTIPPLQQAQASGALSSPPPTVMVPVGVLKHPGTEVTQPKEQRRVWFADGILPNGEVADATKLSASGPPPTGPLAVSHDRGKEAVTKSTASENVSTSVTGSTAQIGSPVGSSINLVPEDGLPPILISTGVKGDYAVEEQPSQLSLMLQLEEGGPDPLVFVLNANLLVMVKLVNYVNRKCWSFTTKGMHAVGQAEIIILLQCLPDEKCIPKDIFSHCIQLYQDALAGNVVGDLGHSFFAQSFLGSREHGGFLYVTATFQSMQDLVLPNPPYLFGILIQKWETPWAKVFPIRLMLRLGAEYRYYPCPLFSVRFRKPLFGETGHTIMNLLADFRNYQYKLPVVQGLVVNMEVRKTCIHIPSNRYNEMMKAMNKSNEHVLAFGACFNEKADSHLVCVQNDDGNYQTQAISIHNQPRKVTGASFFVFSGALKSSSGYLAKSSIVEDGMMVQISAETMDSLRQALREMKDFTITCGKIDAEEPQEHVHIQWTEDDKNINKGVVSPIDGKSMDEIASVKIFHGSEFKTNGKVIRWTEVFFLQSEDQPSSLSDPADHSKLTENVAKAFCLALCPHLKLLKEDGKAKLGLRVTLDSDQVGYQAGSNGQPLPSQYMNDLDNALVPVIHGGACQLSEGSVVMELIFYILESFS